MNAPRTGHISAADLQAAASAYQAAKVIHHCAVCESPCCRLDTHVLELEWQQVKVFWQLAESRQQFDKRLASGKGPEEIRAAGGRYFAHRKPCPAYDEAGHSCRVYDQAIKPAGCSDYPVYGDGDCLIADLRCEAVDIKQLVDWIAHAAGPGYRIQQSADREFPFLVTLWVKPARKTAKRPIPRQRKSTTR